MPAISESVRDSHAVVGFSDRFQEFLAFCGFDGSQGLAERARLHCVAFNTMKNWYLKDLPPRTFPKLVEVVGAELKVCGKEGAIDHVQIASWLLAGDRVPHPLVKSEDVTSWGLAPSVVVAVLPRLIDAGKGVGVDFLTLPDSQQRLALIKSCELFYKAGLTVDSSKQDIIENPTFIEGLESVLSLILLGVLH